jgi:DNA-binding NtrC family response regulator
MEKPELHICVVDRNRNVREFLRRELSKDGYHVAVVADRACLMAGLCGVDPLDIVILDVDLRGVCGMELLRALTSRTPSIPVIVHTYAEEVRKKDLAGAAAFVEKDGTVERLRETVRDVALRWYPDRASGNL